MKEIIAKLNFIQSKTFVLQKAVSIGWEYKSQTGRKYLQNIYLIKDCHPKYAKNIWNSRIRKQLDLKGGQWH